jgi:two-component system chemotaxis sensor kinase CheA
LPGLDPVTEEFLAETWEHLEQADRDLVALERDPGDGEALARVFRAMHTLKGTSGFLAFERLERISHAAEEVLSDLRDGALALTTDVVSRLLAAMDAVRVQLEAVSATGCESSDDVGGVVALLAATRGTAPAPAELPHPRRPEPSADMHHSPSPVADPTVRVGVAQLEALMPILADLVDVRSRLASLASDSVSDELSRCSQRLSVLTSQAQQAVLHTRLQPISRVWDSAPRIARDAAESLGKQVSVELSGGETSLDRAVLEAIRDPLIHLVRNAVGHGIETVAERIRLGKPAMGTLRLRAASDAGQVVIEVTDDGAGIDVEHVLRSALARGLLSADPRTLSRADALALVFLPGLSTSETVTELSGRGVGMDVVRSGLERIGGTVDVTSDPGRGTTFRLRVPLTLAVVPAVVVTVGGRAFVVPQPAVLGILPVTDATYTADALPPTCTWRGRSLPALGLADLFGLPSSRSLGERTLLVARTGDRLLALLVDDVVDVRDVVVKPLGAILEQARLYAGATLVDDGELALILDVEGLADRVGVSRSAAIRDADLAPALAPAPSRDDERVLVSGALGRPLAIPFALVDRLESIPQGDVRRVDGAAVAECRGGVIPLALYRDEPRPGVDTEPPLNVVVVSRAGRRVGLVVDSVDDLTDDVTDHLPSGGPAPLDYRDAILEADPAFFRGEPNELARPA